MLLPKNTFAWLLAATFAFSCKSNTNIPSEENQLATTTDTTQMITDTAGQQPNISESKQSALETIKTLVANWNLAHNNKDFNKLAALYAEEVNLYGSVFSNADAISYKKDYFKQSRQTYQQVLGNPDVIIHSPFVAKASFVKKVVTGKTTKNHNAYLMLEKVDDQWKIVAESDEAADEARTQNKTTLIPIEDIATCETAAEAVFRSSKYVQQMLQNPNTNYKLEYKPGDKNNPNNRYWFWVYANAPNGGSTETYGRFQVDPKTGTLYEMDLISGAAKPIDSAPAYQAEVKRFCGGRL